MTMILTTDTVLITDIGQTSKSYNRKVNKIVPLDDGAYTVAGDASLVDHLNFCGYTTAASVRDFMLSKQFTEGAFYKQLANGNTTLVLKSDHWSGHLQCRTDFVYSYADCFEPEGSASYYINHMRPHIESRLNNQPFLSDRSPDDSEMICLDMIETMLRDYFYDEMKMVVRRGSLAGHLFSLETLETRELSLTALTREVFSFMRWMSRRDDSCRASNIIVTEV